MDVISFLLSVPGTLSGPSLWVAAAGVWIAAFVYCQKGLAHAIDRQRIGNWLRWEPGREAAGLYRKVVAWILRRLEAAARPLSREVVPAAWFAAATEADAATTARSPWGWPVLDFAMRSAVVYTIALLFVQWHWFGEEVYFGPIRLLSEPTLLEWVLVPGITFLIAILLMRGSPISFAFQGHRWWRWPLAATAAAAGLTILDGLAAAVSVGLGFLLALASEILGAALIAATVAGTSAFAMTAELTATFSVNLSLAIVTLGGIVAALGLGYLPSRFIRQRRGFLGYALLTSVCVIALLGNSVLITRADGRLPHDIIEAAKTALLVLGIFPLVNAWFDYISYAITLTLVRWGVLAKGWRAWLFGLADVAVAVVLFSLLGAALTAIVALMNRGAGPEFYPLKPVFDGAERGDADYFWIYAMIFSTFVPTFLHLVVASFSLVSAVPQRAREWLWRRYTAGEDDWGSRTVGCAGIAGLATVAIVVPVAVGVGVVWTLFATYDRIGHTYLGLFRWVAAALGEPV